MSKRPRLAISMGDPAGIGPEVTLAALVHPAVRRCAEVILAGDLAVLRETAARQRLPISLDAWQPGQTTRRGRTRVLECSRLAKRSRTPAKPTAAGGRAAFDAILAAAALVGDGDADALVTAPISKSNLAAAGCAATGHTELLAELAGGAEVRMMMIGDRLRVALATTHLAIASVAAAIQPRIVRNTIVIAGRALQNHFAVAKPRIAVTGLNPHAGEKGLYGREEIDTIAPAVRQARRRGFAVDGPLAADTAFPLALRGDFDVVVCMYHDQALAPFKLLHFSDGVNFTAGLPYVRTSPDHGTAYDIAGRGRAEAKSMIAAIKMAASCAGERRPPLQSTREKRR